MNLRERKKRNTRESILASARSLFFELGYKSTSMEMIAGRADVAVGTIYNYFRSKAEIMVAITEMDTEKATALLLSQNFTDKTIEDVIWTILDHLLDLISTYPRELIRELFTATFENSLSNLASGLIGQDEIFLTYLSELIAEMKSAGKLKKETDSKTVAFSMYSMTLAGIMWFSVDERVTIEETKERISAMIGQFCRGILPERS